MLHRLLGSVDQYPARSTLLTFAGLVACGTLLLALPIASARPDTPISWSDALFTATSAASVTGLGVRSTGHDFTFFGQLVILVLIQLGGLGVITISTFLLLRLGRQENLRQKRTARETIMGDHRADLRSVLRRVFLYTFSCELLGTVVLWLRHCVVLYREGKLLAGGAWALWDAVFHSISAFCNAGFGLDDSNLSPYRGDWIVNLTICALVICGGIGFPVVIDLVRGERDHRSWWVRLQVHSKVMLVGTTLLLVGGTAALLLLEDRNALREFSWHERLLVSFFHSTSARTAGFNTIPLNTLSQASLFVLIVLMFIGGGPCSTAGGAKVSTLGILLLSAWARFRGRPRLNLFRRTIPDETIGRATAVLGMMATFTVLGLTAMLIFEERTLPYLENRLTFLDLLFEAVSALCTVGLSTGITAALTEPARMVLVVLMFVGRLGPLSVFIAFSSTESDRGIRYADEGVLVG